MKVKKARITYRNALTPLNLNKVFFLIIHHIAAINATSADIHRWHHANGWNGAGYNEYIKKDGTVLIMRGDHIGAQTAGMNSKSYGIALEGNYDVEKDMPEAQFKALVERCKFHIDRLPNEIQIEPHRKFGGTSCPGRFFPFDELINEVYKPEVEEQVEEQVEEPEVEIDEELEEALNILVMYRVINSPDYWLENAVKGKTVAGEYAAIIIKQLASVYKVAKNKDESGQFQECSITRRIIRKLFRS